MFFLINITVFIYLYYVVTLIAAVVSFLKEISLHIYSVVEMF